MKCLCELVGHRVPLAMLATALPVRGWIHVRTGPKPIVDPAYFRTGGPVIH
jgi:hypothetical protein